MSHTSAQRMQASRERAATVDRRVCADPTRRKKYEKSCPRWLRHYLAGAYFRPFEKPHKEIINGALTASETGGRFVVAAERGIGKSAILWGVVLYLGVTGKQPFPVCVPWADKALKAAMRFWKNALCFNDLLDADYPEYTAPFRHAKGVAQRVSAAIWRDTEEPTGAQLSLGDGLIVFPDNRGLIGGATINGNPRGLNYATPDGRILRPTIAMVDDVQDRKTAKSAVQVRDTLHIIDGDVGGMGEAGRPFPMLMSGNCIEPKDVMHHYLIQAEWNTLRVPCVESWPVGWDDDKSECRKLWKQWERRWQSRDGERAFYRKHKKAMSGGMELSAPAAFRAYEKDKDAPYAALKLYFQMGHNAFMGEKQQQPESRKGYGLYALTPELIESRVDADRAPAVVPEWAHTVQATTDVNPSYALSSAVVAFGANQRSAVLWYGLYTGAPLPTGKEDTEAEKRRKIYEALAIHGRELAALPCRPNHWVIDGGGSPEGTVIDLAYNAPQICGLQASCLFGRGWRQYRPTSRAKHEIITGEQVHRVIERRERQWVIFNADYWREIAQRGWTGEPGAPGSCSLPRGRHQEFAAQVAREQLHGKDDVAERTVWIWESAPGPHDYGDCMTMAYVAAAMQGIGTAGAVTAPPKARRQRRVRHVRI